MNTSKSLDDNDNFRKAVRKAVKEDSQSLKDITVDFAVSEGNGKITHYQVPLNYKARQAIVEAVEGLIPPENPELKVHTYVAGLHDGHNNCREQVLQAIKEWQDYGG